MNKKFLTIIFVSVFLITSLGVISAADDSNTISVKIVWDDNVNDKPEYVTVNLLKDGKIADTAKLNEKNSWEVNFSVVDEGNYEVKEVISSDYSTTIKGNAQDGFIIETELVEKEVLGASNDETPLEESDDQDVLTDDAPTATDPSTVSGASTATDESNNNSDDTNNSTDDNATDEDSEETTTTTTTTTKIITKKVAKEDNKKPASTEKLKKTGFPLVVLVVAVFVAVFVPFTRKK